jgi:hypothetical protein
MNRQSILFILSFSCLSVVAQSRLKSPVKVGLKFGSGSQNMTGCLLQTKPRVGFMGGFWVQIKMNKSWTLQSEFSNIGKGIGLGLQQPRVGEYWLRLSYFEVPLLFQYNKQGVYLEFGPSIAALINSGEYTTGGILPFQADLYPFSNKDISFNLGAGILLSEKWRLGLRLTHSLLPVRSQLPGASRAAYNRGVILALSRELRLKAGVGRQLEEGD